MSPAMIPAYWLYGERRDERFPDALHIETIVARSALHNWSIQPHRHDALFQFFLITQGGGRTRIDGQEHALAPGSTILLPPLVIHEFRFDPGTDGFVASVAESTLRRLFGREPDMAAALGNARVMPQPPEGGPLALEAAMRAALAEFAANLPGREPALSAHAEIVGLWFARAARRQRAMSEPVRDSRASLVRRFVEHVETSFRSHRSLTAYADELGVSAPHLSRCCRETLGHSAAGVIHDRLMLEARRDLVYTSMPISQISFRLGFSDPAYFSRFFAARAGMSPASYRASA